MTRLMVTGGAGFIGSNFIHYWRSRYPEDRLVVVDALTYAGNPENIRNVLDERCLLITSDINDTDRMMQLLREHQLTTIVHFAAESHVDRSIDGPDAFIEANILGTHSLLKAARQVWLSEAMATDGHRFHHVSTDEVYGSLAADDPAFSEQTPYAPNSPYASSKASSDFLVRAYHHTYGLNTTISNCSNNYGPLQFPEKLIPLILLNLLQGKELPVYGDGQNVRDWLYVEDHARGVELCLTKGQTGCTYNIGGVNEWKNIDIVRLICQLVSQKFAEDSALAEQYPNCPAAKAVSGETLIRFVEDRAGHDFRYSIDSTLIANALGFHPSVDFETGLSSTIDWYMSNQSWWKAVLDGSYRGSG